MGKNQQRTLKSSCQRQRPFLDPQLSAGISLVESGLLLRLAEKAVLIYTQAHPFFLLSEALRHAEGWEASFFKSVLSV